VPGEKKYILIHIYRTNSAGLIPYVNLKFVVINETIIPNSILHSVHTVFVNQDSAVGVATCYGLDGQGIETRWGRDFPHLLRPALDPSEPPTK